MATAISSSEYSTLFNYSLVTVRLDNDLVNEANRLAPILARFEATCREYRVHVSHLPDQLRSHAHSAEQIDRWVRDVGQNFLWADQSAIIPTTDVMTIGEQRASWLYDFLKEIIEKGQSILGALLVAVSIRPGTSYENQIIIKLPHFLKHFGLNLREVRTWAGLAGHLNTIKYTSIPNHILKVGLAASVVVIAVKWVSDIREFTGSKLYSAMTVDALLTLGGVGASFGGAKIGMWIGAGIGTLIVPGPGTVIGGAIGAVIGGVAAGLAYEWAIGHYKVREFAIELLDVNVFQPRTREVKHSINWIDETVFQPIATEISRAIPVAVAAELQPASAVAMVGGASLAWSSLPSTPLGQLVGSSLQEGLSVDGSAVNELKTYYSSLGWNAIFASLSSVAAQTATTREAIADLNTQKEQLSDKLTNYYQLLREAQSKRAELVEASGRLDAKVNPSEQGWRWGFDDGWFDAPYRSKADDLQEEIVQLDKNILELQQQYDAYFQEYRQIDDALRDHQVKLHDLTQRAEALVALRSEGIKADGPTTKADVLDGLGGCTHFVALKRNLNDWKTWPHAHAWNDAAANAGYEMGKTPVKGSIIVFEASADYNQVNTVAKGKESISPVSVDATYGHVAYVEDVDWSQYPSGLMRIKVSEGNYDGRMGSSGPTNIDKWIEITPEQLKKITFIYDKV